jgi:Mor family transcriptional regulator
LHRMNTVQEIYRLLGLESDSPTSAMSTECTLAAEFMSDKLSCTLGGLMKYFCAEVIQELQRLRNIAINMYIRKHICLCLRVFAEGVCSNRQRSFSICSHASCGRASVGDCDPSEDTSEDRKTDILRRLILTDIVSLFQSVSGFDKQMFVLLDCVDTLAQCEDLCKYGRFREMCAFPTLLSVDDNDPQSTTLHRACAILQTKNHKQSAGVNAGFVMDHVVLSISIIFERLLSLQQFAADQLCVHSLLGVLNNHPGDNLTVIKSFVASNTDIVSKDHCITGNIGNLLISEACAENILRLEDAIKAAEGVRAAISADPVIISMKERLYLTPLNTAVGSSVVCTDTDATVVSHANIQHLTESATLTVEPDGIYSAVIHLCKTMVSLRKTFIEFKSRKNAELHCTYDEENDVETDAHRNTYISSLHELSEVFRAQTQQDQLDQSYTVIRDVLDTQLCVYEKSHLELVERAKYALNSPFLFVSGLTDSGGPLSDTEEATDDDSVSTNSDGGSVEDTAHLHLVSAALVEEVALLEHEILYATALKLLVKGICECSLSEQEMADTNTDKHLKNSADTDKYDPSVQWYYLIPDSLDYPSSYVAAQKLVVAEKSQNVSGENAVDVEIEASVDTDDLLDQEALSDNANQPVGEPQSEVTNDDLSALLMLDLGSHEGEAWERKAQSEQEAEEAHNLMQKQVQTQISEDAQEEPVSDEQNYEEHLSARLSELIEKSSSGDPVVNGVTGTNLRHHDVNALLSLSGDEKLPPQEILADLATFKKVSTNIDSGLKIYQLLSLLLSQSQTHLTADLQACHPASMPILLSEMAAIAEYVLTIRRSVLVDRNFDHCLCAIEGLMAVTSTDVSIPDACDDAGAGAGAGILPQSRKSSDCLFERLFPSACSREINGVLNFISNEQVIQQLTNAVLRVCTSVTEAQLCSPGDADVPLNSSGLLYISRMQTDTLTSILNMVMHRGLYSLRAYHLCLLTQIVQDICTGVVANDMESLAKVLDLVTRMQTQQYFPSCLSAFIAVVQTELRCVKMLRALSDLLCLQPDSAVVVSASTGMVLFDTLVNHSLVEYLAMLEPPGLPPVNTVVDSLLQVANNSVICRKQIQYWYLEIVSVYFRQQAASRTFMLAPSKICPQVQTEVDGASSVELGAEASLTNEILVNQMQSNKLVILALERSLSDFKNKMTSLMDKGLDENEIASYIPHENARQLCKLVIAQVSSDLEVLSRFLLVFEAFWSVREEIRCPNIDCLSLKQTPTPSEAIQNMHVQLLHTLSTVGPVVDPRSTVNYSSVNVDHLVRAVDMFHNLFDRNSITADNSNASRQSLRHESPACFHQHIQVALNVLQLRKLARAGCWDLVHTRMASANWPPHFSLVARTNSIAREPAVADPTPVDDTHAHLEEIFVCNKFDCVHQIMGQVAAIAHTETKSDPAEWSTTSCECGLCLCADELCLYQTEIINRWAITHLLSELGRGQVSALNFSGGNEVTKPLARNVEPINTFRLQAVIDRLDQCPARMLWSMTLQLLFTAREVVGIRLQFGPDDRKENAPTQGALQAVAKKRIDWPIILRRVEQLLGPSPAPGKTLAQPNMQQQAVKERTCPQAEVLSPRESPLFHEPMRSPLTQIDTDTQKLHDACFEELHAIRSLAREHIVFEAFLHAATNPTNKFSSLQIRQSHQKTAAVPAVSVSELENACELFRTAFVSVVRPLRSYAAKLSCTDNSSDRFDGVSQRCAQFYRVCMHLISLRKLAATLFAQTRATVGGDENLPVQAATATIDLARSGHKILLELMAGGNFGHADAGSVWVNVDEEIRAIIEHLCFSGMRAAVEYSCTINSAVYKRRCNVNVSELLLLAQTKSKSPAQAYSELLVSSESISDMCSVTQEMMAALPPLQSDKPQEQVNVLGPEQTVSAQYYQFYTCACQLIVLRDCVNSCLAASDDAEAATATNGDGCTELNMEVAQSKATRFRQWLRSKELIAQLGVCHCATQELLFIQQECSNMWVFTLLVTSLRADTLLSAPANIDVPRKDGNDGHFVDLCPSFKAITISPAIAQSQSHAEMPSITSSSVAFLLDCAKHLVALRECIGDYVRRAEAFLHNEEEADTLVSNEKTAEKLLLEELTWFQIHSMRCSLMHVRQEYLRTHDLYQNVSQAPTLFDHEICVISVHYLSEKPLCRALVGDEERRPLSRL